MSSTQLLLQELDEAIQGRLSDKRIDTLRRITDIYLGNAKRLDQQQRGLFDDVLGRLIGQIETKALVELSERLAPVENAPSATIRRLAGNDSIGVAGPILTSSKSLTTSDLVDIAKMKGQDHLMAISRRDELVEAVTDVLVDRGDSEVVRTLAVNRGANFSKSGFSSLITRAELEQGLAELVVLRSEMSDEHFRELTAKATTAVRQNLMRVADSTVLRKLEAVLADVAASIDRASGGKGRNYADAQRLVRSMLSDRDLLMCKLSEFSAARMFEMTVVLLSELCGIKISSVEQLLDNRDDGGILILCKALEVEWKTASDILATGGVALNSEAIRVSCARFSQINKVTAQRVLRFWQIRRTAANPERSAQPPIAEANDQPSPTRGRETLH